MRLGGVFRRLIAVESFTDDRPRQQAEPPPAPAAGARWGQPATFDVGSAPEPAGATLTVGWLHEERLFRGIESHRQYAGVAALSDQAVTAEAIRSVTFYLGEREVRRERREVGDGVTSITPQIEAIREYVRLDFPFDVEGDRGEPHPPETPPREEPDYG